MKNPTATMIINGEPVKIELYPDWAPNTVNNFISLANSGYYDGLMFHRVIEGFMIQGGCPKGTGTGGPGYTIKAEFNRKHKHEPGVISMARSAHPDSAGSQFFIMHKAAPHLDGQYTAFGKVIDGIEIINKVATTQVGYGDKPLECQTIESIRVETDKEYPAPVTINE